MALKEELANKSGVSQKIAKAFLDAIPVAVMNQLQKNGRALIPGFVAFNLTKVPAKPSKVKTTVGGKLKCSEHRD